jgi:hypothetical protein
MKKTIAIFGAGVAGLSCVHTLLQETEKTKNGDRYEIIVYEKLDSIGGLARSSRDASGCATEYCWRVFFGFYKNLFGVMKQIPQTRDKTKTTYDTLVPYKHQNITDKSVSILQKLKLINVVIKGLTSCQDRLRYSDCLTWHEVLQNLHQSNLYSHIGEWLGMDRYRGSYNSVISVGMEMQIIPQLLDPSYQDYVTNRPTSEALFDDWQIYLQEKGAKIKLQTEILAINVSPSDSARIHSVQIRNSDGSTETIYADEYVFALPVQVIASLTRNISKLQNLFKDTTMLSQTCLHTQVAFQVYFSEKVSLGKSKNAFLEIDSPWDLIVLQYDQIYDNAKLCTTLQNVKGGWSIAVCTAYIPGKTIKKPFESCSYEEIKTEIWSQLMSSEKLKEIVRTENPFELSSDLIVHWAPIWNTFSFRNGKWSTTEPKFTNNAGSLKLRPSYQTNLKNMYLATGYVRETIDIFSMEAACVSGKLVASEISKTKVTPRALIMPRPLSVTLGPLRALDFILFKTNRAHISDLLFGGSSFLMIGSFIILVLFGILSIFRHVK